MRKFLVIYSIFLGGILLAQNNEFANNYSTSNLEKIQKTVPENQKHEFYKQYFRAQIFENMQSKFNYKKYSATVLKKFTDSVIAGNTANESPENSAEIIKNINENFDKNIQNSDENYQLLAQNAGLFPGQSFPAVNSEPEVSAIYETISGEILTYVTENGFAAGRHFASFKIYGNEIKRISVLGGIESKNFTKKVSKYIKGNWRYEDRAGYEIKKTKNGEYLISTALYKEDDGDCCPSMAIQYKTKDFKNFIPLKISKEENKWIIIK